MKSIHFRKLLPWLVVAAVRVFGVYRLKFAVVPVAAHTVVAGPMVAEVMGTGTLRTHFKAAASPKSSPTSALETKARESQTA